MKITLINARGSDFQVAPFGLMYIASVLEKENHDVEIFDPLPGNNSFVSDVKASDIIGISFLTTEYLRAKEIVSMVRDKAKYLVAGGVHVTAMPERTMRELGVDFCVVGEGEYTFRELARKLEMGEAVDGVKGLLWRKGRKIIVNERRELIQNLDELPFPARHLLDYGWYIKPPAGIRGHYVEKGDKIMASRGCPYNCIFCGSCNVFGRKTRRRSVANVIEEIKFLKSKYKINALYFMDDTLITDEKWILDLCKEMKKVGIMWACQARINQVNERVLRAMKEAGCVQLDFGIESGSDKVLKALRKGTTAEMQKRAFDLVRKVGGFTTLATIMIGNPEEKEEDIELTKRQILKLNPDVVQVFYITPFPGSDLYDIAMKKGWIKDRDFSLNWDVRRIDKPVMEINFTGDELAEIRRMLRNKFFMKNYIEYMKRPLLVSRMLYSFVLDRQGFKAGMKKLMRRNIEGFARELLKSYNTRMYKRGRGVKAS